MRMVVVRDAFNPVSYPEIEVLRFIHGDDAVLDVKAIAKVEQSEREEKERLSLKYGTTTLETVFPGRNPQMPMELPKASIDPDQNWWNPLDKEVAGFDVEPKQEKSDGVQTKAKQTKAKAVVEENPFAE
jgi:hypothetical protein